MGQIHVSTAGKLAQLVSKHGMVYLSSKVLSGFSYK